ncbi:MAG: hypothetical protein ACFE9L_02220 [Candidatus Hodarchaeota archaeon]
MSMDPYYVKAAIEVLELIENLYKNILQNQSVENFQKVLNLIVANPDSYLGEKHGLGSSVTDNTAKTNYWEGVRDMVKLAGKQWSSLHDHEKFLLFIQKTRKILTESIQQSPQAINIESRFDGKKTCKIPKEDYTRLNDIHSLAMSIERLKQAIKNLPNQLRQEINQIIEDKIASELETLKTEIRNLIEDKLSNEQITPDYNIPPAAETPLPSTKIQDRSILSKEDAINRIHSINSEDEKKLLLDNEDIFSLTLRDALKILRDED